MSFALVRTATFIASMNWIRVNRFLFDCLELCVFSDWFSFVDEKTPAAMITPSALAHSQSYAQKMTTTGAVVKQHQLQPQQQQSCSSEPLDSSSSSAATKPNFNSVGEIATGVMLAGCVTSWGWGYGLGWQEPVKHLFSKSPLFIHILISKSHQ